MVVVPYPHAAAHQRANAAEMVDAGAAILVDDDSFDGDALRRAGELLGDPQLAAMAGAARAVGRPGAARANAELLVAMATRAPLPSQERLDALVKDAG
jgi:UDP-N-acetylglucosamine--N-acetylmuramyl-(pentapeptide) pyrophosphoryl-undecaprenol N-acetylglucosamine transferase